MSAMRDFWKNVVGPSSANAGSADATQGADQAQAQTVGQEQTQADHQAQTDAGGGCGVTARPIKVHRGGGIDLNTVVNSGSKTWDVMKDNVPQYTSVGPVANAMPKGASAGDLIWPAGDPQAIVLQWHTNNIVGNSIDYDITLRWAFNGSYKGKGKYINSARVFVSGSPSHWNKIAITVAFDDPENVGSPHAPIAQMGVLMTITVTNLLHSQTFNFSGFIRGDGIGKLSPA